MDNSMLHSTRERRRAPRQGVQGRITVTHKQSSNSCEGKLFNISNYGISFSTDLVLGLMAGVDIKVEQSPYLPKNKHYSGKVVWAIPTGDLDSGIYRYGIAFYRL